MRTLEARQQVQFNPKITVEHVKPQEMREGESCDTTPSAIGQTTLVREHRLSNGDIIKKVALVSMAYPGGSTADMSKEVLSRTLSIPTNRAIEWEGVNKGKKLFAFSETVEGEHDLSIFDRFVENSGDIIAATHPNPDSKGVKDFFEMQKNRAEFLDEVKKDVEEILSNPEFMKRTPFDPKFQGKGLYVQEMYVDKYGELYGVTPDQEKRPVIEIAADKPHKEWLYYLKNEINKPGNRKIGHGEDDTVKKCGGNEKSCAEYFEMMEKQKNEKRIFGADNYADMGMKATLAASIPFDEDEKACDRCGQKSHGGQCAAMEEHVASE